MENTFKQWDKVLVLDSKEEWSERIYVWFLKWKHYCMNKYEDVFDYKEVKPFEEEIVRLFVLLSSTVFGINGTCPLILCLSVSF